MNIRHVDIIFSPIMLVIIINRILPFINLYLDYLRSVSTGTAPVSYANKLFSNRTVEKSYSF